MRALPPEAKSQSSERFARKEEMNGAAGRIRGTTREQEHTHTRTHNTAEGTKGTQREKRNRA
eukprot:4484430-Pyramimonas_sp.AAC.1